MLRKLPNPALPAGVLGLLAGTICVLEALWLWPGILLFHNLEVVHEIEAEGASSVAFSSDPGPYRLPAAAVGLVLLGFATVLLMSLRRRVPRRLRAVALIGTLAGSLAVFGAYGAIWGRAPLVSENAQPLVSDAAPPGPPEAPR